MNCQECEGTGLITARFVYGQVDTPCNCGAFEPERNEFGRWETPAMTARAWARNEGRKNP